MAITKPGPQVKAEHVNAEASGSGRGGPSQTGSGHCNIKPPNLTSTDLGKRRAALSKWLITSVGKPPTYFSASTVH